MTEERIIGEKYKVVRELGAGAMGSVFEVEHIFIKKHYALKLINPELAQNPEFKARALRESQASAAIRHENIVDVVDFGETSEGAPYIVMEFLEGEPLTDIMAREAPMPPKRALTLTAEILKGLAAAHAAGIVHRDIKPDNIMVLEGSKPEAPRIKILDFGISKMKTTEEGMTLTRTNTVMGTPFYMSLEQCRGAKDVDGRADVFSVGVILHEMLSGSLPYTGDTFAELVVKLVNGERNDLREAAPWLHPDVVALVERATAVDRRQRFTSAQEMLDRIQDLLERPEVLAGVPGSQAPTPRLAGQDAAPSKAEPTAPPTKVEVPASDAEEGPGAEPAQAAGPATPATKGADGDLEWSPRSRSVPLLVGLAVGLLAAGGGVYWALGRRGGYERRETPAGQVASRDAGPTTAPRDAAPAVPVDAAGMGQADGAGPRPADAAIAPPSRLGEPRARARGRPRARPRTRPARRRRRRIRLKDDF